MFLTDGETWQQRHRHVRGVVFRQLLQRWLNCESNVRHKSRDVLLFIEQKQTNTHLQHAFFGQNCTRAAEDTDC